MNLRHYLGKYWAPEYDCWGLVREFYAQEHNIELPQVAVRSDDVRDCMRTLEQNPYRSRFVRLDQPEHGCIAEMGMTRPCHVGIYLEAPKPLYLHNYYRGGVVCEPSPRLPVLAYWQHGSICTTPHTI